MKMWLFEWYILSRNEEHSIVVLAPSEGEARRLFNLGCYAPDGYDVPCMEVTLEELKSIVA